MAWYWLSFVKDNRNAGCCNVEADSKFEAVKKTHILGINPGGECVVTKITKPEIELDTLYSREQLMAMQYETVGMVSERTGIPVDELPGLDCVCEDCNKLNNLVGDN